MGAQALASFVSRRRVRFHIQEKLTLCPPLIHSPRHFAVTHQVLSLAHMPTDKGFTLVGNLPACTGQKYDGSYAVPPRSYETVCISWRPEVSGSCREILHFHAGRERTLQIVLYGVAKLSSHDASGDGATSSAPTSLSSTTAWT